MLEDLKADIINQSPDFVTSKWVLERIPFIFQDDMELYIDWKDRLSALIGVDGMSIAITGSAAAGYSLNPEKNFKAYGDGSDVDIAIISHHYFNISWHTLRNLGPKRHRLPLKVKESINDHKERLIYWGTIATDKIVQLLPFGEQWIRAMTEMGGIPPSKDREVKFRIYNEFESLRAYQSDCINKLRIQLIKQ